MKESKNNYHQQLKSSTILQNKIRKDRLCTDIKQKKEDEKDNTNLKEDSEKDFDLSKQDSIMIKSTLYQTQNSSQIYLTTKKTNDVKKTTLDNKNNDNNKINNIKVSNTRKMNNNDTRNPNST